MLISDWSSDVCSSDLPGCDLQALVDELIELHAVERDEFNRVRLISMHIALTNIAAEGLAKAQAPGRSEEHTSELQSLMRSSYAVFCLNTKRNSPTLRRRNDYAPRSQTSRTQLDCRLQHSVKTITHARHILD